MDTENKIQMYKAVEQVCTAHHLNWNTVEGFGGAFSRFATKVATLDLLITERLSQQQLAVNAAHVAEMSKALVREIDLLLHHSIDKLVTLLNDTHASFYRSYHSARGNELV